MERQRFVENVAFNLRAPRGTQHHHPYSCRTKRLRTRDVVDNNKIDRTLKLHLTSVIRQRRLLASVHVKCWLQCYINSPGGMSSSCGAWYWHVKYIHIYSLNVDGFSNCFPEPFTKRRLRVIPVAELASNCYMRNNISLDVYDIRPSEAIVKCTTYLRPDSHMGSTADGLCNARDMFTMYEIVTHVCINR